MTKRILEGITKADKYDARRSDIPPADPATAAIPGAQYVQAQRVEYDEEIVKIQGELKKLWQ
jgi:hypothetical protein